MSAQNKKIACHLWRQLNHEKRELLPNHSYKAAMTLYETFYFSMKSFLLLQTLLYGDDLGYRSLKEASGV